MRLLNKIPLQYLNKNNYFVFTRKMTDKKTFETLNFDNLVLRTLPIDPIADNYVRPVKDTCFSKVKLNYYLKNLVILKLFF